MRKFLMTIMAVATLGLGANSASAAIVNYSGSDIDMGTVSLGQSGTITADTLGAMIINSITGALPSNSMITFTYNFAGNLVSGLLGAGGEYAYTEVGGNYAGSTFSLKPVGAGYNFGTLNGSTSTALAFSSANIDFVGDDASTVIGNKSAGLLDFANVFAGLVVGDRDLTISYNVSAVPLPAALPLFGAGLLALAGYGVRKRKKEAV